MKFSPKSIRRHKKDDPYSYLVDNLPIAGLLEACVNLQLQIQSAPDTDDYTTSAAVSTSYVGKSVFENRTLGQISDVDISSPISQDVLVSEDGNTYTNVDHKNSQLHEFLETIGDLSPENVSGQYLNFNSDGNLSSINIQNAVTIKDFVDSRYDDEGPDAQNPPWLNNGRIWFPDSAFTDYWGNPIHASFNQFYVSYAPNDGYVNSQGQDVHGKCFFPQIIGTTITTGGQFDRSLLTDEQWMDRVQALGNMPYVNSGDKQARESDIVNFGGFGSQPIISSSEWSASASKFEVPGHRGINPRDTATANVIGGEYIFPDGFIIKWEATKSHYYQDEYVHHWGGTQMEEIYAAVICGQTTHTGYNNDRSLTIVEFDTDKLKYGVRMLGSSWEDVHIRAKVMCVGRIAKTW